MDFELQWLLIGLPMAFVLGWVASRLDQRQWRRDRRDAPRAYFEGLNLLLNEQQDKAIDAFIEAVQHDPDTTELHFALGNLFRRRGEFERSVRVHQHLLSRADLRPADHDRAQHALAQDFAKAGLFDRAEVAWRALLGSAYDNEARLALLSLFERSRDWAQAITTATELEQRDGSSFATRIAHYHCEQAMDALAAGDPAGARRCIDEAIRIAPEAPRPPLLAGQFARDAGDDDAALAHWANLAASDPARFALVAADYADAARRLGRGDTARDVLDRAYAQAPLLDTLRARDHLDASPGPEVPDGAIPTEEGVARRLHHLAAQPSLGAAAEVLAIDTTRWHADTRPLLHAAVQRAAAPLQRYRCAACGFMAHHYFWQCPGCQGWDTFPPRPLEQH
ncbi:MAG: lipopolysaccharide assembly protein LapB [Burkholderiaceae bacterium]|nr:lipopolysaccharide assembly protein LapB [Burkholderiaceae bacterium]